MEEVRTIITQESAKISCNFEQAKKAIQGTLEEYKGAVFTEESKTYAKKHVANLRAQKKALQDSLRDEKKKYMQPWDTFEAQAKQLIEMYDEPINLINGQVQAFEENRIEKKKQLIAQIYADMVPDRLAEYIPLEQIYNQRWENATVKEKEIRREILELLEKTRKDIETIESMESDAVLKALSMYQTNLDLTEAVSYINSYERQKQEILVKEQERRRLEEEERIRRGERERMLAEQRAKEEKEEVARQAEAEKAAAVEQAKAEGAQEAIDSLIPDIGEEANLYEYRISLSDNAKVKLEMYMDSVGIEWELME